jgi:hypothetical protein
MSVERDKMCPAGTFDMRQIATVIVFANSHGTIQAILNLVAPTPPLVKIKKPQPRAAVPQGFCCQGISAPPSFRFEQDKRMELKGFFDVV